MYDYKKNTGGTEMDGVYKVSLARIIKELNLESLYMPQDAEERVVSSADVSRPGLQLSGFFDFYDNTRLQILGRMEIAFIDRFIIILPTIV